MEYTIRRARGPSVAVVCYPDAGMTKEDVVRRLTVVQAALASCKACPDMVGPVVHGPPIPSRVFLLGQAPGPHEGKLGRPFAWTAGKTLFRWLEDATGAPEPRVRAAIYFAAVARCFPGKAKGGGDRRPSPDEIARCSAHLSAEMRALSPKLVLAVGTLAIAQVLGREEKLADVVGNVERVTWHGVTTDVLCLPHPSGASTWHRTAPGKALLTTALSTLGAHPEMKRALRDLAPAG